MKGTYDVKGPGLPCGEKISAGVLDAVIVFKLAKKVPGGGT